MMAFLSRLSPWLASMAMLAGCASKATAPPAPSASPVQPALSSPSVAEPTKPVNEVAPVAPLPVLAQVEASLAASATANGVDLDRQPGERLQVRARGDAAFGSAKASLSPRFKSFLQELARQMQAHPEISATITGHTDSIGNVKGNERLSLARARAVQHELVGQGVGAGRVSAEGKGAREPVAGNDSAEGRGANRRVDIVLGSDAH